MNTIEQNVEIFRADQFKKAYRAGVTKLSISNDEHVLYAVKKAYVDLTPRTLKKCKPDASIPAKERNVVLGWLASELQKYLLSKNREEFNQWHRVLCREFLERFNGNVLKDRYHPLHFGKSQKIVNMALKYIRCFDDTENYAEVYDHCHMAVDSYIISWYNKTIPDATGRPAIRTAWSNLSEQEYDQIQGAIMEYLESPVNTQYSRRRFEAEFDIWWIEKQLRLKKKTIT